MKLEYSAGGVVYKKENNRLMILVCQHSQHHGWVFPKGLIGDKDDSETKEDTAVREVKEETGIDAEIIQDLEEVSYWYKFDNQKIKKTVYYFIMSNLGGDITVHDDEMENVEWLDFDLVDDRLTYKSDKIVWKNAKKIIKFY